MKKTLLTVALGVSAYGTYGKLKYGQSATSFLLEKSFRASGYKDRMRAEDPEKFGDSFTQAPDLDTFPARLLRVSKHREYQVEGMQVFSWLEENSGKVILYLHGGGYVHRASRLHYLMINRIGKLTNSKIVFPTYGLGPRNSLFTELPKILVLYQQLVSERGAQNVVVMGDSAGGGLAVSLLQALRTEQLAMPGQAILLSPFVNAAMDHFQTPYYDAVEPMISIAALIRAGRCWVGEYHDLTDPLISPVNLPVEGVCGFPKITSFVGTHEVFFPDIRDFHGLLSRGGVDNQLIVGERMIHAYPVFPTPEGRAAQLQIAKLINAGD
ncbi:alpha/beta hydrolase [Gleimia sp. 6138-11-ORH1]|uniref:alpha/beta hydrolase fold domain-containing protein n=1 Tax=Gleimia sp. 6138-11-ORH1 TaxID=2973937 RepID=UPI00216A7952|nr:alpha/beta hydrolase [Gleimia sp. 6138-11-ORH1]MCS4484120.1 alpha/beta hydrolase [Gleimia sp. 6138-11-ORH1]